MALAMKAGKQSKACVFQSYPINRLSLGQQWHHFIESNSPYMTPMQGEMQGATRLIVGEGQLQLLVKIRLLTKNKAIKNKITIAKDHLNLLTHQTRFIIAKDH